MHASTAEALPQPAIRLQSDALRLLLLTLFVLSGFSALIYQSIWTHYLGLMLGHAAYAQTLVLIMFMGGMALGSWWVSRHTLQIRRLVGCYAAVEAAIGLLGLIFHPLFNAVANWNLEQALPAIGSPGLAATWQWASAAALIAPQTVLLGATFPLIAAGVLRAFPGAGTSAQLGGLYFTNGIGAALGALAATFLLLPAVGMQGALQVAGVMNLLLAAATAWTSGALREGSQPLPGAADANEPSIAPSAELPRLRRALLWATFGSSAASFGYEIGWVRLLNQALGTTLHGFELMLASFIAGLALGGLWVQRRGPRIGDPVRYAGYVQVAMGVAALLSVPVLAGSYAWAGWLVGSLTPSDGGYTLYSLATAFTAMVVMLPAAFFAGMTLPLFTAALLREGGSERAVGQVYAANTLGAIAGVVLAVHLLVPQIGVVLSLLVAATVDVLIGLVLLRRFGPPEWTFGSGLAALGSLGVLTLVLVAGLPNPLHQAAGVFRSGLNPARLGELVYFKDGSTATISVRAQGDGLNIATNGKPDAGMNPLHKAPSPDEITMLMLGSLPLAAHPAPRKIALIGWGSGLSTHTVLGSRRPERVDTIEIEPAMIEGARSFHPRNVRAYKDPRSHIRIEDARKFLAVQGEAYDVIVSEPSNPWVSGVSSLFTQEFYRLVRRQLSTDGVLVQWIHTYEMSDALLAQMLAALIQQFPNSEVYQANAGDLVVLAHKGRRHGLNAHPWEEPELASELQRVGLGSRNDLEARRLGGPALLRTFVRQFNAPIHSDFWPTVALQAPAERFKRQTALTMGRAALAGAPLLRVLDCREPLAEAEPVLQVSGADSVGIAYRQARLARRALLSRERDAQLPELNPSLATDIDALLAQRSGLVRFDARQAQAQLNTLALATFGQLDRPGLQELWNEAFWGRGTEWQPDQATQTLLRLFGTVSRSDWAAAHAAAQSLVSGPNSGLQASARDLVLTLGLLSLAAQGDLSGASAWHDRHRQHYIHPEWRGLADFTLTWARHEPRCQPAK
ncbi:fused MFS/spermidine synthase [Inhella proteolytica]|uniref:Fused MFS/spermidine synthase n=1 Tax=Inhella proteolytica TaxID=2795029 RepID=A0A931NIX5_9BURK|nr:fused MFS/spermidine synthase [Inhella proteolytica]MBH9578464.1 fused MFS/spermidine synthase [Inhella proteolytica]